MTLLFSPAELRRHLKTPEHATYSPEQARAAVTMLFRFDRGYPEVLLMQRAEREDDPWSGQISLPGGREQANDRELKETAIRETREEVGIDLSDNEFLGCRNQLAARARGRTLGLVVVPFVFTTEGDVPFALGGEAQAAFWLRCDQAMAGDFDGTHRYEWQGKEMMLPCWNVSGYTVWGMTYMMLSSLLSELGATQPAQASAASPKPR